MPGFSLFHYLPEFAQTHSHSVDDWIAIQPSQPLLPASLPTLRLSQHQGLYSQLALHIRLPKYWNFRFSISPSNKYSRVNLGLIGLISLLSSFFSYTTLQKHQFFSAQPSLWSNSHIRMMTTGKTIALTICTFIGKLISLLFNMLSWFIKAFPARSKCLFVSWLQSLLVILEPKKIKSVTVSIFFPHLFAMKRWGQMPRS